MPALLLLVPLFAPLAVAETTTAAPLPPLGTGMHAAKDLIEAGAKPRYGAYWVGPWMTTTGWGGLDWALRTGVSTGTTPVVYWYYWGDSISPSCIENGCDNRTKTQWFEMTRTLAQHVQTEMGGREVLIVLENEFNKGGVADSWYAPTFDGYLEQIALELKNVTGVEIVLGFGAWGESAWSRFPKAAAQSDYIGFQMMRASTRHTEAQYRDASERIVYFTEHIAKTFGKPSFLYDLALSSYPDAHWEQLQAAELAEVFDALVVSGQTGLQGMVYRSLRDNPTMGLHNYFGYAERHWGLWYAYDGGPKPAWWVWLDRATNGTAFAPNVPGAFEGESFAYKANGMAFSDAAASGGQAWLLWSNGEMRHTLVVNESTLARVTLTARSDLAEGVGARVELHVNGTTHATLDVPTTKYATYTADIPLQPGYNAFAVRFVNDYRTSTEDRNLRLDRVDVALAPTNEAPVASFSVAGSGLAFSFDASASSDPDGDALAYAWDFGDGTSGSGVAVEHAYATGGDYLVRLVVSDGNASAETTHPVVANRAPHASFHAHADNLTVTFDAAASYDDDEDTLTYAWELGDGARASGRNVTHAYAAAGTYVVNLTVSDGREASATNVSLALTQANRAPVAAFGATVQGLTVSLDAGSSSDPDGDTLTYHWDLGDGTNATGGNLSHTYAVPGTYAVALTVSDGRATASAHENVTAVEPNRAPTAAFSALAQDLTVRLDANGSHDPDGDVLTYHWDLGDGTNATGPSVEHTYASGGAYVVTLTVSDGEMSATASAQVEATAPNQAPHASFVASGADLSFTFDASASSDPDGDPLTYTWELGDGTHATGSVVAHDYASDGDFVVTLRVSDGEAEAVASQSVKAVRPNAAPVASFTTSGGPQEFTFDASGSSDPDGDALAYAWSFGDGTNATGVQVTRSFAPGNHTVTLMVTDARGLASNATAQVHAEEPTASLPLRVEAESFAVRDNGMRLSDTSASAGAYWLLWANGGLDQGVSLAPGTYAFTARARGDYADGWPVLELRADGRTVGRWTVDSSSWKDWSATVQLAEGAKLVTLEFVNDYRTSTADRNVRLDALTVDKAQPRSPVRFEAEDALRKDNGMATSRADASGGKVWLLWSNGALAHDVHLPAGRWRVDVVATGDNGKGWPYMEIRVDGQRIAGSYVDPSRLATYSGETVVAEGTHRVSVHFTNDARGTGYDRNLRPDLVVLTPV